MSENMLQTTIYLLVCNCCAANRYRKTVVQHNIMAYPPISFGNFHTQTFPNLCTRSLRNQIRNRSFERNIELVTSSNGVLCIQNGLYLRGHSSTLQLTSRVSTPGHSSPPCSASAFTCRVCVSNPPPHDLEHSPSTQSSHSQWTTL